MFIWWIRFELQKNVLLHCFGSIAPRSILCDGSDDGGGSGGSNSSSDNNTRSGGISVLRKKEFTSFGNHHGNHENMRIEIQASLDPMQIVCSLFLEWLPVAVSQFSRTIDATQCKAISVRMFLSSSYPSLSLSWLFFCRSMVYVSVFNSLQKIHWKNFINLKTESKRRSRKKSCQHSQWCSQFSFHLDSRTHDEFLNRPDTTHTNSSQHAKI